MTIRPSRPSRRNLALRRHRRLLDRLAFPTRSTATWPAIGTRAARSGPCSIRSPTSCCCWRRWSRSAWCRSIICAPFPIWFPAIIISRDALLLGGYLVLRHFLHQVEIRPHWTGKLSTFFTFLAIGAVLFKLGPDDPLALRRRGRFRPGLHGDLCAAGAEPAQAQRSHRGNRLE